MFKIITKTRWQVYLLRWGKRIKRFAVLKTSSARFRHVYSIVQIIAAFCECKVQYSFCRRRFLYILQSCSGERFLHSHFLKLNIWNEHQPTVQVCVSTNYEYKRHFSNKGFPNYCSYRMWRWDLMHWCIKIIRLKAHWQWFLRVASFSSKITHIIKQWCELSLSCASLSWLSRKMDLNDEKHWICSVSLAALFWEKFLLKDVLKCKLFINGSVSSEVDESSVDKLMGSGGSVACGRSVTLNIEKKIK